MPLCCQHYYVQAPLKDTTPGKSLFKAPLKCAHMQKDSSHDRCYIWPLKQFVFLYGLQQTLVCAGAQVSPCSAVPLAASWCHLVMQPMLLDFSAPPAQLIPLPGCGSCLTPDRDRPLARIWHRGSPSPSSIWDKFSAPPWELKGRGFAFKMECKPRGSGGGIRNYMGLPHLSHFKAKPITLKERICS